MVERKLILRRPLPKPAAAAVKKPLIRKAPGKSSPPDPFGGDDKPAPARGGVLSGFAKAREINTQNLADKEARMAKPMVFKVDPGKSAKCILLDKEPERIYLHSWQDGAKRYHEEVCLQTEGLCPLCEKLGQKGTYTLMFTCISLVPFEDREGKKHNYSRMLFPIKPGMSDKFERLYLRAAKGDVNRGFRGMALQCFRSSNSKSPRTGDDFEFGKWIPEADLKKYGDASKLTDYAKAFPRLTAEAMAKKYAVDLAGVPGAEDIATGDESSWDATGSNPF